MEVWVIYGEDTESTADLAFEVRRFVTEGQALGHDVRVYKPSQFDLLVTQEERDSILIDGSPVPLPDFVLPYFHEKERGYFSLAIVRQLERLGVHVFNKAATIEQVADKLHTHQVLAESGLPTPATMLAKFPVDIDLIESTIGFPVVVKTLLGSNGSGVFLVDNRESFLDLMELIGETNPNIQIIFQKFVAASKGRDLRLFVVDGTVVASMERRAKDGSFKANFSTGGSVHMYEADDEAKDIAIRTTRILDIDVAGIDLLFTDEGGYTVCEANTFPGFKGLEKATGENIPAAIFGVMEKHLAKTGSDSKPGLKSEKNEGNVRPLKVSAE